VAGIAIMSAEDDAENLSQNGFSSNGATEHNDS
jgi:hypothetical protein